MKRRGLTCGSKIKRGLRASLSFLFNPRLLLCFGIAWMITNGWGYVALCLGVLFRIRWLQILGGTYLGLLWLPFTPEKIATMMITIFLLRRLFPKDEKTLGVLSLWHEQIKTTYERYKEKRRDGRKRGS